METKKIEEIEVGEKFWWTGNGGQMLVRLNTGGKMGGCDNNLYLGYMELEEGEDEDDFCEVYATIDDLRKKEISY